MSRRARGHLPAARLDPTDAIRERESPVRGRSRARSARTRREEAGVSGRPDDRGVRPSPAPTSCRRTGRDGPRWSTGRCGCASTSPTTAPASTAGRTAGLRTVQGELESALATVLRAETVAVTVRGRTDTGVHARGQVVHVDIAEGRRHERLLRQLDGVLADGSPCDGRGRGCRRVRRALLGGVASLRLPDRRRAESPTPSPAVTCWVAPAARPRRDRVGSKRSRAARLRVVLQAPRGRDHDPHVARPRVGARAHGLLVGNVVADAFCHHMVRSLVGCLVAVGEGRRPRSGPGEVLAAAARDPAVAVAPAHGLTLEEVGYPPDDELAAQAEASRTVRTLEDQL